MKYFIFKYLWVIAVLPKMAQLPILGAVLLCLYIKEENKSNLRYNVKSDPYFTLLIVCNAIYAFSILANTFGGQYELERILAAGNTFCITCIAFGFYHFYSMAEMDMEKVEKYMFVNMNILFVLFLLYCAIGDKGNLPIIGNLSRWDKVHGEYTTRFLGYLEYANMTVFVYLYCCAFSVNYLSKKIKPLASIALEILYLLPLIAANSRTGMVCGAAMVCVSLFLTKLDKLTQFYLKYKAKVWAVGVVLAVIACVMLREQLSTILEGFLSYRSGSTTTRSEIYVSSIKKMLDESPVWGCGIKSLIPNMKYLYGSHSTYIGMFYKTGLLGGILYLAATLMQIVKLVRRKERSSFEILTTFTFLALYAFAILEDLDGSNWNLVMFMSLLALCIKSSEQQKIRGINRERTGESQNA